MIPEPDVRQTRRGLTYAFGAFLIWGLVLPIYLKGLAHVSPLEVLAHRVLWSIPLAVAILAVAGTLRSFPRLLRPRIILMATLTALLISVNWGVYIWAIANGHAIESALGYYVNPLINVLLGMAFLGERPNRLQGAAILLAAFGVGILTYESGGLPWVSLALALSFGFYGLLRKTMPFEATEGFLLEVLILFVPALLVLFHVSGQGEMHFGGNGVDTALLVGTGVVTAVPLILYAAGARLLPYTTIGLLQYLSPTLIFLTAVFVFGEPFGFWQGASFAFIWAGLALYTASMLRGRRGVPEAATEGAA
ncbi:EamA family transporter RarD [Aureimonas sp. AU4]|uniref:EamA family transporter RarD n=1 Tax=Aureimonas sp. AU4 TaxID=1638163 RepID=UPI0007854394|nr:EamA family transporter RarD [Aureimonas sp. AU4]